ncbi:hypothetical protein GPEL0_01f4569 [Geoanaerobacter pelophilus]|uniref:Uncharacterized protein n=1 Tax=Geoanaerobacter pelophilus TaxID=60036 RepID=A0ABQ0MMQ7_9BACT|nr:hypothetical protein GPEL0_01f4569 [Geoanaerobacter pelophilus]
MPNFSDNFMLLAQFSSKVILFQPLLIKTNCCFFVLKWRIFQQRFFGARQITLL